MVILIKNIVKKWLHKNLVRTITGKSSAYQQDDLPPILIQI